MSRGLPKRQTQRSLPPRMQVMARAVMAFCPAVMMRRMTYQHLEEVVA